MNKLKSIKLTISIIKKSLNLFYKLIAEFRYNSFKNTLLRVYHYINKQKYQKKEIVVDNYHYSIFHQKKPSFDFEIEMAIDILIPVYNGKEFLQPLFKSIIDNTSLPYRLLIADDKSPDKEIITILKKFKKDNLSINIQIVENEENLGFVKTINKLSKLTKNHFVLLNTDTEVPPYWLERLMYPIFKMKNIASTTPFTNAGMVCSFPKYLEDNEIFENIPLEQLDNYFQYVNFDKTYIELISGVGFCMGMNKNLVDKIGMFDTIYGKGYAEESDWCQRARKNGFRNIHVTNLFVYHKHGGSFKNSEKQRLTNRNLAILGSRYLNYHQDLRKLVQKNSLKFLRETIKIIIKSNNFYSTLIIDYNLNSEVYYKNKLINRKLKDNEIILLVY